MENFTYSSFRHLLKIGLAYFLVLILLVVNTNSVQANSNSFNVVIPHIDVDDRGIHGYTHTDAIV
ncbi:MAG: hypothetical protein KJP26_10585, partial [Maribacter sp.]|nr:hypothetical protein [Maribacter sp.]